MDTVQDTCRAQPSRRAVPSKPAELLYSTYDWCYKRCWGTAFLSDQVGQCSEEEGDCLGV